MIYESSACSPGVSFESMHESEEDNPGWNDMPRERVANVEKNRLVDQICNASNSKG